MFWFVWEWAWDAGHCIFYGLWYAVLIAIGIGLLFVAARTGLMIFLDKDVHH